MILCSTAETGHLTGDAQAVYGTLMPIQLTCH